MISIADQFVQNASDEGEGFGMIEADTAGEAALGELADLGDEEFIYLL